MKLPSGPLWIVAWIGLFATGGCTRVWTTELTLPRTHVVRRDPLVIHSDFPLVASHRLIEELLARRSDLVRHLELPLSEEPIHIYLFSDADRFGGYIRLYYPKFPPRRAYFLETDTRLQVYAQWGDWVAEDLRHEVAHAYVHSVVPNVPLWLDEGLAECYEAPRGWQGLNRSHLERLAERLASERFEPDLARLESLRSPFEMSQDDYAEAWAWIHFLLTAGPQHRVWLRDYLMELRQEGTAEPLSRQLARRVLDPKAALRRHLRALVAATGTQPPDIAAGAAPNSTNR